MRRKDDDKQQRIKEAVIELILQEGFDGTSISKIARRAEVSPASCRPEHGSPGRPWPFPGGRRTGWAGSARRRG